MSDLNWIKDLVRAEQQMEDAGLVDMSAGFDPEHAILSESVSFMNSLRESFIQAASAFNQMRGLAVGGIKIYGISQTQADFMLFRHGFKLLFTLKKNGVVAVRFQNQGSGFVPGAAASSEKIEESATTNEDIIEAKWGAFGQIIWTYKRLPVSADYMVRYYMSRFVKESAK